jgi:GNAT superfamily N-acetyltransferase
VSTAPLVIEPVPYDHPAVTAMTEAVQDYYRSLYDGPDNSPVDPTEFAPPNGCFFVGYRDGVAVAMGGWRWIEPLTELGASRPAEIKRMYVDASMRGRGYARTLLAHLESTAAAGGADAVVLSTGQPQQDAIGLYRSEGYADVPRFGYFAPYPDAVHLGKWLAPKRSADPAEASEPQVGGTAR